MVYNRPTTNNLKNIPLELGDYPAWIIWREEPPKTPRAKWRKIPVNPSTLENAKTSDPKTWTARDIALLAFRSNAALAGIGFVFSEADPYAGLDLDNCYDASSGKLESWASELVRLIDSYTEISPSRTGVKIFVRAKLNAKSNHFEFHGHEVEVYDRGRYFALTGERLEGTPAAIGDRQKSLDSLLPNERPQEERISVPRDQDPLAFIVDKITDKELLQRIKKSAQGEKFTALMEGSTAGYAGYFAASGALCQILAGWTRCNPDRIDSLYRMSGLYEESWWNDRCYAGRRSRAEETISNICASAASGWLYDPSAGALDSIGEQEFERLSALSQKMMEYKGAYNTDLANTERFIFMYGDRVRYCPAEKSWYAWDGKHWIVDKMENAETLASQTMALLWAEAGLASDTETDTRRKLLFKWAKDSAMHGRLKALLACASSRPEIVISPENLDSNRWLLNLENGTYDLLAGNFREHRKEDLITCMAPISYDPEALPSGDSCKQFSEFIYNVTEGDFELVNALCKFLGYCLSGDTSEQLFGIFFGPTETGKTTIENILRILLGQDYAGTIASKCLFKPDDRESELQFAKVATCRLVCSSEGKEGKKLPEAFIKNITGHEPLVMRKMYVGPQQFMPRFKLILATNFLPTIRESGNATWRRMQLFPFAHRFAEGNKHFAEDVVGSEGPAILNWLLLGFKLYLESRFKKKPKAMEAALETYREDQDEIAEFLKIRCEEDSGELVLFKDLYSAFRKSQVDAGEQEKFIISARMFASKLDSLGIVKGPRAHGGMKTRRGIRLLGSF